jgi:serine protease AprX
MTEPAFWRDWVLLALADSPGGRLDSEFAVIEEVAIRFADRFAPADRSFRGDQPRWHDAVRQALADLRSAGLVSASLRPAVPGPPPQPASPAAPDQRAPEQPAAPDQRAPEQQVLTPAGQHSAESVRDGVEQAWRDRDRQPAGQRADQPGDRPADQPAEGEPVPDRPAALLMPGVIAPPLRSDRVREKVGFPLDDDEPGPVMAELNLRYGGGPEQAFARLAELWTRVTFWSGEPGRVPTRLAEEYATGRLSLAEMKRLVSADAATVVRSRRSLRRLWPDFPVREQVDGSCVTVQADAARRAFNAYGDRIVWAVIDSGIWAGHPHFAEHNTLRHESVAGLHRLFPLEGEPSADPELALVDESGHGTHVAGIIAGAIESWLATDRRRQLQVTESRFNVEQPREPLRMPRTVGDISLLAGMAPKTKLVSLKVLQAGGAQEARVARVMRALEYVRKVNGESTESMRIHGVNLSLGYEFDPEWFACGQSPLCKEVDKLVRTGVVVVVAAGNSGYGSLAVTQDAPTRFGLGMTINDPGNAELAITVGSTHRDAPHAYGVSYFSSKGPTGDGRAKPDLVAPGERITSCAAGRNLTSVVGAEVPADTAVYVEDTGTSMAAPHVSGAIAALLSVRAEFIGRPDRVKRIIVGAATSLGRSTAFEGAGLLDLMRALQTV